MARFRFLTTWCVDAPIQAVWDAVYDAERWPEWWPGVERAEKLKEGDENDVGCVWSFGWRSRLPYTIEFESETTRVEPPYLVEGFTRGELNGVGSWRFYEGAEGTAAVYQWSVATGPRWMSAVAPLSRPLFVWNHDVIMRDGANGLARRLGARLIAHD